MRSFRESLAVRLILVFSLLLLPAYIFAANNTLEIQCVDQAGKPVTGAKVQIQNLENGKWKDKKSDNNGVARFDKLDDGVYRILSRQQGFAPALYEFIAVKGDKQQAAKLQFEPGADKQLYFESPEVDQKALEALKAGVDDLRNGKFADAENKLKISLTLNPSNPETSIDLALAQLQQKKWKEAEASLQTASRVSGAVLELKPREGQQQPNPYAQLRQRAEDLLQKLQGLRLRTEGSDSLAKRNFPEAVTQFKESLKHFPDDPDLFYNLALAEANARMFADADQSIEKAIALRPAEKAYQDLKQQIAELKQNDVLRQAQAILDEGEALFKKGEYPGAVLKYQEAKAMIPPKGQAMILTLIAKAEAQQNHPDQAIQAFKQAMELAPDNADYKKALAQYYVNLKRYDDALNVYASGGSGPADQALVTLGQQLSQQGNNQVAQLAFERAIQANPNNGEAYYELGMLLYFSKENDKRAKELLSKYMEIGKNQGHLDNAKNFMVVLEKRSPK